MPKPLNARKARFEAALKLAGLEAKDWAALHGITPGHLSQVLSAKRESRALQELIDAFTRDHLKNATAA